MAETMKQCAECGRPLVISFGVTINGQTYHYRCWDRRGRPIPARRGTIPDLAHQSGDPDTAS